MFLDTHALVYLHAGELDLFPALARYFLEQEELLAGPMAILELHYLYEIKRIAFPAAEIIQNLADDIDLKTCDRHGCKIALAAAELSWTRDPFDRLIAAQALVNGERLLTRDRLIRANCSWAFWE